MPNTDIANTIDHSYPTYGRQFRSYKWYKPVIVGILFGVIYIILSMVLTVAVTMLTTGGDFSSFSQLKTNNILVSSYDDMDLANGWQSLISLGGVALMIPALWLASAIVRDRPFSSYQSSRGGWSRKVFWKAFPAAIICVSIPIIVNELFYRHNIDNFQMKFSIASFIVVTLLGPLQCIAEEYVFRGLLMQTLGSWFRVPVVAVILQAVFFAVVHPYDMLGKIGIVVSGLVFGLSAWMGRGIEVSSAFHIANNMTIFYLQGLNMATIETATNMNDFILEVATGVAYVIVIFIISKRHNWFSKIRRDDAGQWNQRIEDKIERKEAKAAAKAEKQAAKRGPEGAHDESSPGKHFKQ